MVFMTLILIVQKPPYSSRLAPGFARPSKGVVSRALNEEGERLNLAVAAMIRLRFQQQLHEALGCRAESMAAPMNDRQRPGEVAPKQRYAHERARLHLAANRRCRQDRHPRADR